MYLKGKYLPKPSTLYINNIYNFAMQLLIPIGKPMTEGIILENSI